MLPTLCITEKLDYNVFKLQFSQYILLQSDQVVPVEITGTLIGG